MALGIKNSWKYEKDLMHILNKILNKNVIPHLRSFNTKIKINACKKKFSKYYNICKLR